MHKLIYANEQVNLPIKFEIIFGLRIKINLQHRQDNTNLLQESRVMQVEGNINGMPDYTHHRELIVHQLLSYDKSYISEKQML